MVAFKVIEDHYLIDNEAYHPMFCIEMMRVRNFSCVLLENSHHLANDDYLFFAMLMYCKDQVVLAV